MNPYMNQYQNNMVKTASPEQLLIMLYDGAIRFVRQAREALVDGESLRKRELISRALAIISEFSNTLDREVGGEIAENLDALYAYMMQELTQANLTDDTGRLEVVEGLLVELRTTWGEAIEVSRNEATATGQAVQGASAG